MTRPAPPAGPKPGPRKAAPKTDRPWPAYRRVPAFLPVPTRGRADGWTAQRQGDFIGFLAETGSVSEAAAQVGVSRESAYRLRRRRGAEGFAAAWDFAVETRMTQGDTWQIPPARKFTPEEAAARALGVTLQVVMRRGRYVGTRHKASEVMLLRLMARLARTGGGDAW